MVLIDHYEAVITICPALHVYEVDLTARVHLTRDYGLHHNTFPYFALFQFTFLTQLEEHCDALQSDVVVGSAKVFITQEVDLLHPGSVVGEILKGRDRHATPC